MESALNESQQDESSEVTFSSFGIKKGDIHTLLFLNLSAALVTEDWTGKVHKSTYAERKGEK